MVCRFGAALGAVATDELLVDAVRVGTTVGTERSGEGGGRGIDGIRDGVLVMIIQRSFLSERNVDNITNVMASAKVAAPRSTPCTHVITCVETSIYTRQARTSTDAIIISGRRPTFC